MRFGFFVSFIQAGCSRLEKSSGSEEEEEEEEEDDDGEDDNASSILPDELVNMYNSQKNRKSLRIKL